MMDIRTKLVMLFLVTFLSVSAHVSAQSAPSPLPTSTPTRTNITAALEKAGQFTFFIRLLKSTLVGDQLNSQINSKSNQGFTIFAPTDNSFSNLPPGTLNSLSDQQKIQLIQFHVLPTVISLSQFQTVSNPVTTQAGDSSEDHFPLNVSTSGNQVNLTTGVNTARIDNTILSGSKVVIYQVDQVLLPAAMFQSSAPAPAPAKPEKAFSAAAADTPTSSNGATVDTSAGIPLRLHPVTIGSYIAVAVAAFLALLY
ncbi:hypothetical protein MLD38_035379 [Melastoma candidum]|uniref:Uncharacterized protein n=1 Tax=Melastoma candidum TaxID=119954 RepID=A0ACB9LI84_9MYRT|nr:hypothetical protein MLD38_035379 [Melastoma candidum]